MDNQPKLSIVIPVINLWDSYTKQCIQSLQSKYLNKIILIDNASTDNTEKEATKLSETMPNLIYIRNVFRNCCAGSWNQGAKLAFETLQDDYVAILNNDVLMHPQAFDEIIELFESQKLLKPNEQNVILVTSCDVKAEVANPTDTFTYDMSKKAQDELTESPQYSAFVINKRYWNEVGPFDEDFRPAYFEDNDSHYRVKLLGLKAIVCPTSIYYHYGSKTQNEALGGQPACTSFNFEANREHYKQKWGGTPGQETFKTPFNKEI